MKLSAALIVKNESSCLEKCLKSLKGFDEIVVVDTGSTDNTYGIARNWADRVYTDYQWNDNFAEARNHVLSKVTGDWVLSIDADEELITEAEHIKSVISQAEEQGFKAIDIIQEGRNGDINYFPRLFKRCPEVKWYGAIHNYLSIKGDVRSDVRIKYGYSAAHQLDPNRALRILKKEVEKGGKIREIYYLAREYWYRKEYKEAIKWWEDYIRVSRFLPERADAYLMIARCYWTLGEGEKARVNCLSAIEINSNFKEALKFMAELSWEHNAIRWREFAELATNENVLFIRGESKNKKMLEENINTPEHYNECFKNRNFEIDYNEPMRDNALLSRFHGGRFLDLGCGVSPHCKLAKLSTGSSEVVGMDFSDKLIEVLRGRFPNIMYLVGDVRDLKFENDYFDYIVLGEVLEHMEKPEEVLNGIVRVLKPKGILAMSCPNNDGGRFSCKEHIWSFTEKGIRELLSPHGTVETSILIENKHQFIIGYLTKK
jgi:glycosyltransferase involved in cell wall biosynthesis